MNELRSHRFFDVFEYNGTKTHWGCFLCNHPDRATYFVEEQEPVIEGQLKEKKGGRWSLFKKWKSRYFTLSGDKLTYKDTVSHGLFLGIFADSPRCCIPLHCMKAEFKKTQICNQYLRIC